ncbi:MAG: glycosyltransferase family 2 protein [Treponema sp.]|nr:glycosyltransferase family 2 protein [Treponema sp.]
MISVCIPTYNGEKYLKQQLDSIIPQLSQNDEIIVSDDSSTDDTKNILKKYKEDYPFIQLFLDNKFKSPIYNLENALKHANGDFIFLSDQDDIWKKNKVQICMNYLQTYDLVVSDADVIDSNNTIIYESFFSINNTKQGKWYNLLKNGYLGCCMAFNKQLLTSILPFPHNLPMHDIWIGNYASFKGYKVEFIKEKLIAYRRHGQNASIASEKSKRKILSRLKDRYIILYNLKKHK